MIAVFYHLGQIGDNWRKIYTEHMERLEPVIKEATAFFLHVEGEEELPFAPANAIVVKNSLPGKLGEEGDTLESLHTFAVQNPGWKILYTHSKGVTKPVYEEVKGWTDFLFSEVVDKREKYLNALSEVGAAGPLFQKSAMKSTPFLGTEAYILEYFPHFTGNFWWATSEHIGQLNKSYLRNTSICITTRRASEFWICSSGTFEENLGRPWASWNIYYQKDWGIPEKDPEIWFLGKLPHLGCLNRAVSSRIFSRIVIEAEDKYKPLYYQYPQVEFKTVAEAIKEYHTNVWWYCPNSRLFYFDVTDREALFNDLKDTGFLTRNNVFIRADVTSGYHRVLKEEAGKVLTKSNIFYNDPRLDLKGIETWKGLLSA